MKNFLKKFLFISVIVIMLLIVAFIIIQYDAEGEKSLPFSINKILLVSTVNGDIVDDPSNIWNINIAQVNDVYMYINKTEETELTIKEIKLENFNVINKPKKGNVKLLRPTGELSNLYTYSEQDYINSEIIYQGGAIDDMKSLEIANTGGVLGFRFSLNDLGSYISNENEEIIYDGNLLKNLGVSLEEIKFSTNFDIIITTSDNINYKGTVSIEMPIDTIVEEGSSHKEITDFNDVVFKRV